MKEKVYEGIDKDPQGAMNPTGNIIRDAWVFGIIPETETCEGWLVKGIDSLYSIVQMPAGVPVGTLAIGAAGATNAALLAAGILALQDDDLANRLTQWRAARTAAVGDQPQDDRDAS